MGISLKNDMSTSSTISTIGTSMNISSVTKKMRGSGSAITASSIEFYIIDKILFRHATFLNEKTKVDKN